ncbi:DUF4363 family protein [Peptococcaceae bacterium 1198_IL3148]
MRLLVSLILIFSIFIGLGAWSNHALTTSAKEFAKEIDIIVVTAQQDQWDAAYQKIQHLRKRWDKQAAWWPIILDHQEIDNIEFALVKTAEYIKSNNKELSFGQLAELKLMIEHIPEKEAVTITNIL